MSDKNDMVQGRRKVLKSGGGGESNAVGIICPLSLAEHRGMVGIRPNHLLVATARTTKLDGPHSEGTCQI